METIKTAFVVVLLLAVLYGVYVVLNKPELETPPEMAWQEQQAGPLQVEYGTAADAGIAEPAVLEPQVDVVAPSESLQNEPSPSVYDPTPVENAEQGFATRFTDDPAVAAADPPSVTVSPASAELASGNYPASPAAPSNPPVSDYERNGDFVASESLPNDPVGGNAAASNGDSLDVATAPAAAVSGGGASDQFNDGDASDFKTINAFQNGWTSAVTQIEKGQWSEALFTLSVFYNNPDVIGENRQQLIDLLDPLAGKVIYSTEHTLEAPYAVQDGESLYDIADRFRVPAQLLANINGVQQPEAMPPGTQLKVLEGPFRAEVDLKKNELVVFLGRYYAGRFAISVGNDPAPQPGEFQVLAKERGHEYESADGIRIPARLADNPYGQWWIDLGNGFALHGSPETMPSHGSLGCISLNPDDAFDVYSILSIGSKVLIR